MLIWGDFITYCRYLNYNLITRLERNAFDVGDLEVMWVFVCVGGHVVFCCGVEVKAKVRCDERGEDEERREKEGERRRVKKRKGWQERERYTHDGEERINVYMVLCTIYTMFVIVTLSWGENMTIWKFKVVVNLWVGYPTINVIYTCHNMHALLWSFLPLAVMYQTMTSVRYALQVFLKSEMTLKSCKYKKNNIMQSITCWDCCVKCTWPYTHYFSSSRQRSERQQDWKFRIGRHYTESSKLPLSNHVRRKKAKLTLPCGRQRSLMCKQNRAYLIWERTYLVACGAGVL